MGLTHFPHGISSFGVPQLGGGNLIPQTTGTYFFVDDSGSNANDGKDPDHPFADLDYAIGQCTANVGDVIILMPGHTETAGSSGIVCDVAGVSIVGLGFGRARPTITADGATAVDLVNISAANVLLRNIRLVGAASCTALINIAADDAIIEFCSLEHGAAPLKAVTVPAGSDRWRISDCLFLGTAAGPDVGIDIEGQTDDWVVERCDFNYYGSTDLDLAGIRSSTTDTGIRISDCRFLGMAATALDFNSSATGLVERVSVTSLVSTVNEMIDPGDLDFIDCKVGYISLSGATIPATTATP